MHRNSLALSGAPLSALRIHRRSDILDHETRSQDSLVRSRVVTILHSCCPRPNVLRVQDCRHSRPHPSWPAFRCGSGRSPISRESTTDRRPRPSGVIDSHVTHRRRGHRRAVFSRYNPSSGDTLLRTCHRLRWDEFSLGTKVHQGSRRSFHLEHMAVEGSGTTAWRRMVHHIALVIIFSYRDTTPQRTRGREVVLKELGPEHPWLGTSSRRLAHPFFVSGSRCSSRDPPTLTQLRDPLSPLQHSGIDFELYVRFEVALDGFHTILAGLPCSDVTLRIRLVNNSE